MLSSHFQPSNLAKETGFVFSSSFQHNSTYSISSLAFATQQRCRRVQLGWKPYVFEQKKKIFQWHDANAALT